MASSIFLMVIITFLINKADAQTSSDQRVGSCTVNGHLKCIRITAKEVFAEGADGKWSRHWKRMSYIGEACVREHGEKKGKMIEAIFAPPHYLTMFFVNVSGLMKYRLSKNRQPRISQWRLISCR